MKNRIKHFIQLKSNNLPVSMAASMSGIDRYASKYFGAMVHATGWIVCICSVLYLLSSEANSANSAADNRVAAKISQQAGEIEELRRILAKCLTKGDNAIVVGGELAYCGLAMTGIRYE